MFGRQRTGSVVCPGCNRLVGAGESRCPFCGRAAPGMFGLQRSLRGIESLLGLWPFVGWVCGALYVAALITDPQGFNAGAFFAPSDERMLAFGASGAVPVFRLGRWWTLLSAGWLHGGLLHIGFNLYWIRMLAPETAELYGAGRMVIVYTISSIVGFLLSSVMGAFLPFLGGAGLTVGASAPILGLLGALVYYGRRVGSSIVGRQAWYYAIFMIAFGFLMRGVDNWAHLGGFAGGYLGGMLVDPRQPETGNQVSVAVVCLILTLASIVASLVVPVPILLSP